MNRNCVCGLEWSYEKLLGGPSEKIDDHYPYDLTGYKCYILYKMHSNPEKYPKFVYTDEEIDFAL